MRPAKPRSKPPQQKVQKQQQPKQKRAGTTSSRKPGRNGSSAAGEPSTIGRNPLDQVVAVGAVRQLTSGRRPARLVDAPTLVPGPAPGPASKLAITVPQALADQVQAVLALRTDLSFDQLMSSALAEVLRALRQGGPRPGGREGGEIKHLARELARRR